MSLTGQFTAYAAKDIDAIDAMFADDIQLRDWKISVSGKAAAMSETRKNFAAAEALTIDILACYAQGQSVAGGLKIVANHSEMLYVVDVVTFNELGQISTIRAYLGRGD
jgi:hypothetical protein